MREKIIFGLAIASGGILAWNMNTIFNKLPDELNQGAIFRIIYFHVPSAILSMLGFGLAALLSIGFLMTKDLRYDAAAVSVTEVSLMFRFYHSGAGKHLGAHHFGESGGLGTHALHRFWFAG